MIYFIIFFNIFFAIAVYFILRAKLLKSISIDSQLDEVRKEFNEILTEINHTTEKNIEIIEDRIEELKKCEKDAERKIRLLHEGETSKNQGMSIYDDIAKKAVIPKKPPIVKKINTERQLNITIDEPPKKSKIIEAYKNGKTLQDIAHDFNMQVAEVEFICLSAK